MTLREYAEHQFPNHRIEGAQADVLLRSHTAVMQVVGANRTIELERRLRTMCSSEGAIASVVVRIETPTLAPTDGEDQEGIVDLPAARPADASAAGGVVAGLVAGILAGVITGRVFVGVIVGLFIAALGGWIGGLVGGGRFAGERAWEQAHEPDHAIGLIAVLSDDERQAVAVAASVDSLGGVDVRVVDDRGAWHAPNTYTIVDGTTAADLTSEPTDPLSSGDERPRNPT